MKLITPGSPLLREATPEAILSKARDILGTYSPKKLPYSSPYLPFPNPPISVTVHSDTQDTWYSIYLTVTTTDQIYTIALNENKFPGQTQCNREIVYKVSNYANPEQYALVALHVTSDKGHEIYEYMLDRLR
jgi:hypothetical protein